MAFYTAAALLAFSFGQQCYRCCDDGLSENYEEDFYPHSRDEESRLIDWIRLVDPNANWRRAAAIAGAIAIPLALALLDRRTRWFTRILGAAHAATAGGWPWQTVKGWSLPFLVTIPIAAIPQLVVLHNVLLDGSLYGLEAIDWFLATCRGMVSGYSEQILFPLLAVYGTVYGRAWVKWIGRYLIGGYWCLLLLFVVGGLLFGLFRIVEIIVPAPSLSSIAVPALLLFLGAAARLLWLRFSPRVAASPLVPAPPPTEISPWRTRDAAFLLVLVAVAPSVLALALLVLYGLDWLPYALRTIVLWSGALAATAAIAVIVHRRRLGDLLLGCHSSRITPREGLHIAILWILGSLPVVVLIDPLWVKTFFSQLFEPPLSWHDLLRLVVVAPIGEELIFRGVLYEYWTRSFGAARACVLTVLTFLGVHSVYMAGSIFAPATIVYYLVISFALTLLRIRTGAVLPCIFAHAGINYFASF